jgi:hypothetical protein
MKCNLKNGDMMTVDLKAIFPNSLVCGEYFEDDDGNIEIYIPEGVCHTGFYIKIPKNP